MQPGAVMFTLMAQLLLFASARESAGTKGGAFDGATVGDVLTAAIKIYGPVFEGVLETATIWCNGDAVERDHPVGERDEVAVLPPVSGGADGAVAAR